MCIVDSFYYVEAYHWVSFALSTYIEKVHQDIVHIPVSIPTRNGSCIRILLYSSQAHFNF